MNSEQEKRFQEVEKKIEKVDDAICICAGVGIALIAVAAAGASLPVWMAAGAIGAVAGTGVHSIKKWTKNRNTDQSGKTEDKT